MGYPHNIDFKPSGTLIQPFTHVPYYSQFASPELIDKIINHSYPAEDDRRWQEFGFANKEDYVYWAWRGCGPACLKSAVESLGGPVRTISQWVKLGLERDGFIFSEIVGSDKPSGWIHVSLANLANDCGLVAGVIRDADLGDICILLSHGKILIASVTPELGESEEITRKSGHLILIHSCSVIDGKCEAVCVHNPSGRIAELQDNAWIEAGRFLKGFSGRLIHIGANG